ncbi:hypothetical protein OAN15_01385 [bacterium]|nr:hypothetical protein [bacterium]
MTTKAETIDLNLALHEASHCLAFCLEGADLCIVHSSSDERGFYGQTLGVSTSANPPGPIASTARTVIAGAIGTLLFDDRFEEVSERVALAAGRKALDVANVVQICPDALMLPFLTRLIMFLERRILEPLPDISRPLYLNDAIEDFPQTFEIALRKEVFHLYENAAELILHGLKLHRDQVFATHDVAGLVRRSRSPLELDLEQRYENRIKTLYSAIVEFCTRAADQSLAPEIAERIYALRNVASDIVQAVKSIKHLRKNILRYTVRPQGAPTELYDALRTEIARIAVEINKLAKTEPENRSALWLDQERAQIEEDARFTSQRVDALIRTGALSPSAATSFMNDSGYAYGAMRGLIEAARSYFIERDSAMAEVERILSLDEEELTEAKTGSKTIVPARPLEN